MSNNEDYSFITKSLAEAIKSHAEEFREKNEKHVRKILKKRDYQDYTALMAAAIEGSIEVMKKWENTDFNELDGLTPKQYFQNMSNVDDFIMLISEMLEKNEGMLPSSLIECINKFEDDKVNEVLTKIEAISPDKDGKLSPIQKAVIKCTEMIASEKAADPLSRLLFRFDISNADDEAVTLIMDAFKGVGKASIPCLIAACEKSGHEGNIYAHSIMTLADIASKNKTEEIYMYLKECFRKSKNKIVEASALGLYGDGRAIAAIRTYVEKNITQIEESEYTTYRDIVLHFGGTVDDLDRKFSTLHPY